MANYRTSRIIPVALTVIIIAVAIAALISVARLAFYPSNPKIDTSKQALLSTSVDRAVGMLVRGPIVADEDFRSYRITITPSERKLVVYKSYKNEEIKNITLDNNIPAYEQLVYALNRAGFMSGTELTGDSNDTRGICTTGRLYEFNIIQQDKPIKSLWSTSCSGAANRGSLDAKADVIANLFIKQIPDAKIVVDKIWR